MGDGVKEVSCQKYVLKAVRSTRGACGGCAGEKKPAVCLALCAGGEPCCVTSPGKVWKRVKGGEPCTK